MEYSIQRVVLNKANLYKAAVFEATKIRSSLGNEARRVVEGASLGEASEPSRRRTRVLDKAGQPTVDITESTANGVTLNGTSRREQLSHDRCAEGTSSYHQ